MKEENLGASETDRAPTGSLRSVLPADGQELNPSDPSRADAHARVKITTDIKGAALAYSEWLAKNGYVSGPEIFEQWCKSVDGGLKTIETRYIAPPASPWISVSDRLPEVGTLVVAFSKYGKPEVVRPLEAGTWGQIQDEDLMEYRSDYFTHWMPLPQAPREAR